MAEQTIYAASRLTEVRWQGVGIRTRSPTNRAIASWIRYRVDVLKSEHTLGRKEVKVTLGYTLTMTKRMAERKAHEDFGQSEWPSLHDSIGGPI